MKEHPPDEVWARITLDCMLPGCGWSEVGDDVEAMKSRFVVHAKEKHGDNPHPHVHLPQRSDTA